MVREGVFVETARQAAQKTSQLEETVKKLKQIDTNNNKEIAQHVKIVVDSSNQVRDAMLALIKMTKTIQVTNGSTASNIDEKVTAIQTACKEMGVSIKNMITSAEVPFIFIPLLILSRRLTKYPKKQGRARRVTSHPS